MNERTYSTPYAESVETARNLWAQRAGGTFDRHTGELLACVSGYFVGGSNNEPFVVSENNPLDLVIYDIARWIDRQPIKGRETYFGVWTDSKTGLVYFDLTDHVDDEFTARRLGKQRNELAIWDCARGREIRL